jgi:streptomycin 6-kinase
MMTIEIPQCLDWLRATDSGRSWLASLGNTAAICSDNWDLTLGSPFDDSYISLVMPATDRLGTQLVLKIQFPHRESAHEATALRAWNGSGAIRLIDHDEQRQALLLEQCVPGDHLATADSRTGLRVRIELLPRLWIPAGNPFGSLRDEAMRWVRNMPISFETAGMPFERSLLDQAVETLLDLADSQGEQVLIHQDLHGNNVLRAKREPWLAIDPKPLVGEREFGLSPVIRSYELGHSKQAVFHRLDLLSGELGLDRERARLWAFGHAVAWGFEGGKVWFRHLETARWLLGA